MWGLSGAWGAGGRKLRAILYPKGLSVSSTDEKRRKKKNKQSISSFPMYRKKRAARENRSSGPQRDTTALGPLWESSVGWRAKKTSLILGNTGLLQRGDKSLAGQQTQADCWQHRVGGEYAHGFHSETPQLTNVRKMHVYFSEEKTPMHLKMAVKKPAGCAGSLICSC